MGVYQKKQGGPYYIDYYYQGRRIRDCVGPDKRIAEQALIVRKAEIVQGRFQIEKRKDIFFSAFAKTYLEYAQTDKDSWETDQHRLKHLLPFFGKRLLSDIIPFFIEGYKKERVAVVKKSTCNRELVLLRRMFNLAILWGMATKNPMKGVRLFREENKPERILSQDEIDKILGSCTDYSRPIVQTALHTGMRMGEILGLKWGQVDLMQRVITVLHSKNGKVRKIPISGALFETLKGLKRKALTDSVFVCARTGKPALAFRTAWRNVLRKAGIPHVRFHDLRHNFATQLVAGGVDLESVRELMGHSSLLMVGRYAHSAPERKRQAIDVLEGRLGSKADNIVTGWSLGANVSNKPVSVSR